MARVGNKILDPVAFGILVRKAMIEKDPPIDSVRELVENMRLLGWEGNTKTPMSWLTGHHTPPLNAFLVLIATLGIGSDIAYFADAIDPAVWAEIVGGEPPKETRPGDLSSPKPTLCVRCGHRPPEPGKAWCFICRIRYA